MSTSNRRKKSEMQKLCCPIKTGTGKTVHCCCCDTCAFYVDETLPMDTEEYGSCQLWE